MRMPDSVVRYMIRGSFRPSQAFLEVRGNTTSARVYRSIYDSQVGEEDFHGR